MADVVISNDILTIDLSVPERVVSLRTASVVVPLSDIRAVRVVRDALGQVRGHRKPGAGFPGVAAIGTWLGTDGGRAFRDFVLVRSPGPGVVITTRGEFDRIVLGTEQPEQFAAELRITI
jgi:hypothetical protein